MNTSELPDFSSWVPWSEAAVRLAPATPGVYAFGLAEAHQLPRLKGGSDIVYIGSAKRGRTGAGSVKRRLKQHLRPREGKIDIGYRIDRVLKEVGPLQVAWRRFDTDTDARWHEAELLERYEQDHIELPPLNRQESGKDVRQAVGHLLALPPEQQQQVLNSLSGKPGS